LRHGSAPLTAPPAPFAFPRVKRRSAAGRGPTRGECHVLDCRCPRPPAAGCLFFAVRLQKLIDPAPTAAALEAPHLPASLALPTGLFEVCRRRPARDRADDPAGRRAARGFTPDDPVLPNQFADPVQGVQRSRTSHHRRPADGLRYGQMRGSYDYLREQRRTHRAEVRAARAEGRVEGANTAHTSRSTAAASPR
jgi:hypothetical protein